MADQYTRSLFRMLRGNNLGRVTTYPVVAGGKAVGVALPHDNNLTAGAWGAWTQILLAAAAPAEEFWYRGFRILATAAVTTDAHAAQIGSGLVADPPIAIHDGVDSVQPAGTTTTPVVAVSFHDHLMAYPVYQPAATPIAGRSAVTTKAAQQNVTTAVILATGY